MEFSWNIKGFWDFIPVDFMDSISQLFFKVFQLYSLLLLVIINN